MNKRTDKPIADVKSALAERGIRIEIGGCGCCGSPWVKLEIDGKLVVADGNGSPIDGFSIDMFERDYS